MLFQHHSIMNIKTSKVAKRILANSTGSYNVFTCLHCEWPIIANIVAAHWQQIY